MLRHEAFLLFGSCEGHLVFQKKNFPPNGKMFGWDGSFKGATFSTAVFVYALEAIWDFGETL